MSPPNLEGETVVIPARLSCWQTATGTTTIRAADSDLLLVSPAGGAVAGPIATFALCAELVRRYNAKAEVLEVADWLERIATGEIDLDLEDPTREIAARLRAVYEEAQPDAP